MMTLRGLKVYCRQGFRTEYVIDDDHTFACGCQVHIDESCGKSSSLVQHGCIPDGLLAWVYNSALDENVSMMQLFDYNNRAQCALLQAGLLIRRTKVFTWMVKKSSTRL